MPFDPQRYQTDAAYRAAQNAGRVERRKRQLARESLGAIGAAQRDRRYETTTKSSLAAALERIDALQATIDTMTKVAAEPLRPVKPARLHAGKRPAAAVALLGDAHIEEAVVRTTAIDNEYNLRIAQLRVARFFAGVVWLVQHARETFSIDTLILAILGDLISGQIHDENVETSAVPPAHAALLARDWIAAGIQRILSDTDLSLRVPCVFGNHSRTTKRVRAATGYGHSWEWLVYQVLAQDFAREKRVQFHTPKDDMAYCTVLDRELAFAHGDAINYGGGIGGLTVPAIKAMHRWQAWRDVDYYHFGHFHQRLDLGVLAFNGSVIGPNWYAKRCGFTPEPPQQSFYVLDAKRGKTMSCPVWVQE